MSFLGEIKRRKVFQVAAVYLVVSWLILQVVDVVAEPLLLPGWLPRVVIVLLAVGFPIAIILSWAFDLTSHGVERTVAATSDADEQAETMATTTGLAVNLAVIGALALALIVVGMYVFWRDEPVREATDAGSEPLLDREQDVLPNSVAVLLCENLSPNPDDAFFALSIHEEIRNQLAKLRALTVIARTSVMQYADAPPPIPQIAEELNVGAVMECSVRYAGDSILVTAQLIDPETNSQIWSDTYPGDLGDLSTVFAMQADIAMNIANAIGAEFSLEEQSRIEERSTNSSEAYTYYLRALAAPDRGSEIALLDQAIAVDPEFAPAYAKKAFRLAAYLALADFDGGSSEATELERAILENARQALALDPTLGIAQAALAVPLYVMTWRGVEADEAFQRALQLSPNDVDVLFAYSRFKRYRGDFDEVARLLQRAIELDPNALRLRGQLAVNYRFSGNWEAAVEAFQYVLSRRPSQLAMVVGLATVEAVRGNRTAAITELLVAERLHEQLAEPSPFRLAQMAQVYALAGSPDDARRLFDQLREYAREEQVRDADWVRAYIAVGEYDEALRRLAAAIEMRAPTDLATLAELASNPTGDPQLERREFRELLDSLWLD